MCMTMFNNDNSGNVNNRIISFEQIGNCRDLGGLETTDGYRIRTGMLLRSANLGSATDTDIGKMLKELRLSEVVDLRTARERDEKPDALMEGVVATNIPIFDERIIGISHEKEAEVRQESHKADESRNDDSQAKQFPADRRIPKMEELYHMMVTRKECRINLGHALRTIMEHDYSGGSILWHCTEGKDRCGLVSAMVLFALSVDKETVMQDYLMTNLVNEAKAQMYYQKLIDAGKGEEMAESVKNAFLAKESYMVSAFAAIEEEYQDMEHYLYDGLEIPKETVQIFREKILTIPSS